VGFFLCVNPLQVAAKGRLLHMTGEYMGTSTPVHPASLARRLIGARCTEQHEEGSTGRRYLTMDAFFEWERAPANLDRAATALPEAA
jgi:hypothetical protein